MQCMILCSSRLHVTLQCAGEVREVMVELQSWCSRTATRWRRTRFTRRTTAEYIQVTNFDFIFQRRFRLRTAELVQPYGYPLEAHTVQTADGYLLGVFRMPRGVRADAPATHR